MYTRRVFLAASMAASAAAQPQIPKDREGKVKSGDPALDFTLKVRHSESTITLSSYRKKMPVALVFGSYT